MGGPVFGVNYTCKGNSSLARFRSSNTISHVTTMEIASLPSPQPALKTVWGIVVVEVLSRADVLMWVYSLS